MHLIAQDAEPQIQSTTPVRCLDEHFLRFVDKTDTCWLWRGGKTIAGYGHYNGRDRQYMAHRYSYEAVRGMIPPGMHIDHLCRVPACVNPEHLEVVTPYENVMRGMAPRRFSDRTHCQNGHEFTPENTQVRINRRNNHSFRMCLTCHRERNMINARKYRAAKRLGCS